MTEPVFQPRLREDGTLDPEPLEGMGLAWLTSWMRERLSGHDPWFPIDRRFDEDPDLLIVGLLRRIGSAHPLASLLGSAARRLLEEAHAESPYLHSLLRLCQQVALPATSPWFTNELKRMAESPNDFAVRWPDGNLTNEILFAALRQAPGWPGSPSRPYWEKLLLLPQSATLALTSFGTSLEQQASHLALWWRVCPREDRDLELSQLIFGALTIEGEEAVRAVLGQTSSLPPDLRQAIDRELMANGARPLFSQRSKQSLPNRESLKNSRSKIARYFWKFPQWARPKDAEMDAWLDSDLQELKQQALAKSGLDASDLVRDAVMVIGPHFGNLGGAFFGFRRGQDRLARFTPVNVTIINFTEHQLVTYQCAFDLTTGKPLNECIDEYFYMDIVSVATLSQAMTYSTRELDQRILSRIPKIAESAIDGQIQVNNAEIFELVTAEGTSRVVLKDPVLIEGLGGGDVPIARADQAVQAVRTMLRIKKAGALPLRTMP